MSPTVPNLADDLDLDALLRGRDALLRSGSAPPTLHGARSSLRLHGLLPEDAAPAHPDYPAYYYNHNLNPRLPPPTHSREESRAAAAAAAAAAHRGAAAGGSLFVVQPGDVRAPQEDFRQPTYISGHHSRPVGRNALDNTVDTSRMSDPQLTQLHKDVKTLENMHYGATPHGLTQVQSVGSTTSHSFASDLDPFDVRSATLDTQLIRRSLSPSLHGVGGRISDTDEKNLSNGFGGLSSGMADCDDISFHLSGLKLSDRITEDRYNHPDFLLNMASDQRQQHTQSYMINDLGLSTSNGQTNLARQLPPSDIYKKLAVGSVARSNGNYQTYSTDNDFVGCNSNGHSANQGLLSVPNNWQDAGATLPVGAESHYLNRSRNPMRSNFQVPGNDSSYVQYLQRAAEFGVQPSASPGVSLGRNYRDGPFMDLPGYQEAYLGALLAQQKLINDSSYIGKTGGFDNGLSGNPAFGRDVPYQNQLSGSISSLGIGSSLRPTDRMPHFPSILRGSSGGSKGSWNHDIGISEESIASSLLEELKNNKTRSFELSEIVGHVVEFSGDQYGSRFIQQKLETASDEEKNNIFPEILPNARVLMTDVFGNYVIQKFFEYGTENQRNQLADALMGYVLPLSLQMYGCRVIQKALEVVDVDRQTKMVTELDGAVTKCVRDQNGNHVIQKCIECVPQEKIQFIVSSFYGQVVPLSTHPYGCRVIQRVLEHCDDVQTQSIMMEEILQSVCTLAQDQYGNYVIQHVLQHGKQEERACIIKKLAGQIVKMSQQKFASNVVEKCLAYSTPDQRELLIEEMLGTTDENEPLQAMMKDQFGNYVVQKVLESCDDQKLELIISRIKVHLSTLKKYTYGKHIVARVEKLIATGERRIGMSANAA